MRTLVTCAIMTATLVSLSAAAAKVVYEPPNLSIEAQNESLDSVLRSVSNAMHIKVTAPTDLNVVIDCHIVELPVERAFRKMLGDVSYALQWEDGGERLTGLVILREGEGSNETADPGISTAAQVSGESAGASTLRRLTSDAGEPAGTLGPAAHRDEDESRMAIERMEHEARMEKEMEEHEARMAEELEEHKARIEEEEQSMEREMAAEEARIAAEVYED